MAHLSAHALARAGTVLDRVVALQRTTRDEETKMATADGQEMVTEVPKDRSPDYLSGNSINDDADMYETVAPDSVDELIELGEASSPPLTSRHAWSRSPSQRAPPALRSWQTTGRM